MTFDSQPPKEWPIRAIVRTESGSEYEFQIREAEALVRKTKGESTKRCGRKFKRFLNFFLDDANCLVILWDPNDTVPLDSDSDRIPATITSRVEKIESMWKNEF